MAASLLPRVIQQIEKRWGNFAELVRPKPILTDTALKREHLDEVRLRP